MGTCNVTHQSSCCATFFFNNFVLHHLSPVDTLNYTSCENEYFLTQASFYME